MANDLTLKIERRILDRLRAYDQDDPRMKAALLRIGFLLEAQIKLNIRKQKLIDTGRLINSIRSEVTKDGLTVGAYNMPYAAIHEFGGTISAKNARYLTIPMSPEFKGRRASEFGDLFVKRIRNRAYLVRRLDSGQLQFCYMLREQVTMPARPFMRPALQQHKDRIIEIIRDLIK